MRTRIHVAAVVTVAAIALSASGCSAVGQDDIERYAETLRGVAGVLSVDVGISNPLPLQFDAEVEVELAPEVDLDEVIATACTFPDSGAIRTTFRLTIGDATVSQRVESACPEGELGDLIAAATAIDAEELGKSLFSVHGGAAWIETGGDPRDALTAIRVAAPDFAGLTAAASLGVEIGDPAPGEVAAIAADLLELDASHPLLFATVAPGTAHLVVRGAFPETLAADVESVLRSLDATRWGFREIRVDEDGTTGDPGHADAVRDAILASVDVAVIANRGRVFVLAPDLDTILHVSTIVQRENPHAVPLVIEYPAASPSWILDAQLSPVVTVDANPYPAWVDQWRALSQADGVIAVELSDGSVTAVLAAGTDPATLGETLRALEARFGIVADTR